MKPTHVVMTGLMALASIAPLARAEALRTEWTADQGNWADAKAWSAGLPDESRETVVRHGNIHVGPTGTFVTGDLEVARHRGTHAMVDINGAALILTQDSLFLGEETGSDAALTLHSGALESAMDVFVGGATAGPGRANRAHLSIDGGTFVARNLTVGLGFGCNARVNIETSRPAAVHLLDYVYVEATQDPDGHPGQSVVSFTLDEHGVTPITIESHRDGLRIIKDATSSCRLEVSLAAEPPRDDITLVATHHRTEGTFDGLPEGGIITATYEGREYRWSVTYRGGESGSDLVLRNRSEFAAGLPVTHVRAAPPAPRPLWLDHDLSSAPLPSGMPAFAGAEGFGAYTAGGRGGRILYVDNLDDDGPGSLRSALTQRGPREIQFRVGGVIRLRSKIVIDEPFVTLDGEHAPGAGIMLWGHGLEIRTHDVVLRYFRIRIGEGDVHAGDKNFNYATGDGEYALYFVEGATDCIADHLSMSWSTNKMLSTTKLCDRITIQWCLLSESLNFAHHAYASIAGGNRVTWHHNLFAHHQSRCVRWQGAALSDFRNNVVYDWGDTAGYGEFARLNYVGNYLKPGPSTTQRPRLFHAGDKVIAPGSLFVAGNKIDREAAVDRENWRGMGYYFERASVSAPQPFSAPGVTTESADAAYEHVLADVGDTRPARDAVDARVVREVREGTGRIIDHVADVDGGPELKP